MCVYGGIYRLYVSKNTPTFGDGMSLWIIDSVRYVYMDSIL